ncbi:MAG: methyltransferase domain-containing protein [Pseudomonadota bacterium]
MKTAILGASLITMLAAAAPGSAEPRPVAAAVGPAVSTYARAVADPLRSAEHRAFDESRRPGDVLAFAQIKRGETVADFGAGSGYYSELIASAVGPTGQVIALTPPKYYKPEGWTKLRAAHANVNLIVSDNADLAPRSVDAIFSHLVFHDLFVPGSDPRPVLANWYAAVKPGGRVIIADHRGPAGDTSAIAGTLHRIDPAAATAAMVGAGFVADGSSTALQRSEDDQARNVFDPEIRGKTDRFILLFRRP